MSKPKYLNLTKARQAQVLGAFRAAWTTSPSGQVVIMPQEEWEQMQELVIAAKASVLNAEALLRQVQATQPASAPAFGKGSKS